MIGPNFCIYTIYQWIKEASPQAGKKQEGETELSKAKEDLVKAASKNQQFLNENAQLKKEIQRSVIVNFLSPFRCKAIRYEKDFIKQNP